jgi:hypothetical protein
MLSLCCATIMASIISTIIYPAAKNSHYIKNTHVQWVFFMVGDEGFEPPTPSV